MDQRVIGRWRNNKDPAICAHADAILALLAPILEWGRPKIMPALQDLEARAYRAVSWRMHHEFPDAQGVVSRGLPPPDARLDTDPYIRRIRGVRTTDKSGVGVTLELSSSLHATLGRRFPDTTGPEEWEAVERSVPSWMKTVVWVAWTPLQYVLHYAIYLTIIEAPTTVDLRPLLELFRAGNFPIGFDREDRLVVVVSDP